MRDPGAAAALLSWYDVHARALPWRVPPAAARAGRRPDPYRVWLSEVMLQQTTVAAVGRYFTAFTARWPRVEDLAAAPDAEVMAAWAGLGYYARARNLLRCARVVADDYDGRFPQTTAALRALPGIGPYTAAAIAAIAFDEPATVVDGNVERVIARMFAIETPLPGGKREIASRAAELTPADRPGCYAQAVMDLGATLCSPRDPRCGACPWRDRCRAYALGLAAALPRRAPKPAKPVRVGIAYLGRRTDGAWLLEERPARGLLGGMLGWPGTHWTETMPEPDPPAAAEWLACGLEVRHSFTHFHLRLALRLADLPMATVPERGQFVVPTAFDPAALPTVMRKAHALAAPRFQGRAGEAPAIIGDGNAVPDVSAPERE